MTIKRTIPIGLAILVLLLIGFRLTRAAPSVVKIRNNSLGMTILDSSGQVSASQISGLSCSLRNDTSKEIASFVVLWKVSTQSGKTRPLFTLEDKSLSKSISKIKPGEVVECESTGVITSLPEDPFTAVEAMVDFIFFSDGTVAGPDETKSNGAIRNRQLAAKYVRSQLLNVYETQGLDALLAELRAAQ